MTSGYRVIWKRSLIERYIAGLVLQFMQQDGDVESITRAMAEIDLRLSINPADEGESRNDLERILIVGRMCVTYEIHEEEKVVYVLGARYLHKKGS